jgi:hypothetical protein
LRVEGKERCGGRRDDWVGGKREGGEEGGNIDLNRRRVYNIIIE